LLRCIPLDRRDPSIRAFVGHREEAAQIFHAGRIRALVDDAAISVLDASSCFAFGDLAVSAAGVASAGVAWQELDGDAV